MNRLLEERLPPEQVVAIRKSEEIGKRLLNSSLEREIVRDYVNGFTQSEIAQKYIPKECEISECVATGSIGYVIKKTELLTDEQRDLIRDEHKFNSAIKVYELGMGIFRLTEEEKRGVGSIGYKLGLECLTDEERTEYSRLGGLVSKILGRGVHKLTKEQLIEIGKKNGKLGGKRSYELGVGIHGRSKEEMREHGIKAYNFGLGQLSSEVRSEYGKRGGIAICLAKGNVLWSDEEKKHACDISSREEYKHGSKINCKKIANELNGRFHNGKCIRTPVNVRNKLYKLRNSKNYDSYKMKI